MCFTIQSYRFCAICLTLHALTCLPAYGHADESTKLVPTFPTNSSDPHHHLMLNNTFPSEHDHHNHDHDHDHPEHIHNSDNKEHHPDTDNEDHDHDHDHPEHIHNSDNKEHHPDTDNEDHDHEHDHDHDHDESSEKTDEMLHAQNLYMKDLLYRFGRDGVLDYDGVIHILENLGMNVHLLPDHSHIGHSHVPTDSHAGHSHDADHSKHIHDSDHKKHHPDTDHEDHRHDSKNHTKHHDDHNHKNHASDHHHTHSNNTNIDAHKLSNDSDHNVRRRRSSNVMKRQIKKRSDDSHYHLGAHTMDSESDSGKCDDLFHYFNIHEGEIVSKERLLQMCPGILSTLTRTECREMSNDHHDHPDLEAVAVSFKEIPAEVWGYSTIAIVIISMVGLLGVAVVPIMQKVFYNHLLLFLVALAVGALSGDALLHLLPHALQGGHDHSSHGNKEEDEKHQLAILKGLCGMGAIFLFFTMERVLSIVTDMKRKRKKKGSVFVKESGELGDDNTSIPLTECGAMRVTDPDCKEQIMGIHPGQKALTNFAESSHKKCSGEHDSHHKNDRKFDMVDEENPTSVLSHSHHHHGHSHILPTSVASIAWMVILGDGIHNFCDGLAIGAAFSSSITGGFSTSVAVFCHELPHEIGDFAVLLRAGMTVKQAVMYNCVSSVLAFIGMLIGVAIGNFGDSITWVFVSVAGMFLYIALVDMLPELTAVDTRQGEHPFCHLLIQVGGMILGASIMLLIALYEKNLMNILEPV
ncbi:zinc transporter ZIP6-like isoform X2 [Ylistrum balloti]|uniref:zinc transporter ZIP6-like isoform X2 n=1 Tax=Ylistrum balloti TaxID=509963 RepID=UPI002905ED27|nr:zinc transporter ZIP6-like isoform X2 [Ylistrum balloti]